MMRTILSICSCLSIAITNCNADDLLFPNSDFEMGDLTSWTTEGDAFVYQPTQGDNPRFRNRESATMQGEFWIGGFEKKTAKVGAAGDIAGDQLTGLLTSRPFVVRKPYITFRIGAGNIPGQVGVRLLHNGIQVDMGTGVNSESMIPASFDVRKYIGEEVRIQIYDYSTGGWGHINVDDFRGSDEPVLDDSSKFALDDSIEVAAYPEIGYEQALRPQFHFSSKRNWINDPNGMLYDGERYHLYFQHNPKSTDWGNMTWGHATSPDMVHWTQLNHALVPYQVDRRRGTIFSGTAVVDHENVLGKQTGDRKTMCAFFTYASEPQFYQAMAYSTDGGNTFTYWNEGRAVVPNQGLDSGERDPKVFWHAPSKKWVMALWVQSNPGRVRWFTSSNLTDWEFASDLLRDWAFECMDVIFLPVDGDVSKTKCVIYDASFDYEIGSFDGTTFHSESPTLQQANHEFYAAQTFTDAPNGRVTQMGWLRGGTNTATAFGLPYNKQMTFPCDLSLRTTSQGVRLFCTPIPEIKSLVSETVELQDVALTPRKNALRDVGNCDLVDVEMQIELGTAEEIIIDLARVHLTYNATTKSLSHNGIAEDGKAVEGITLKDLEPRDGKLHLRFLIDRLTVETFAWDGERYSANYIFPAEQFTPRIEAIGGTATLTALTLRKLKSAWN